MAPSAMNRELQQVRDATGSTEILALACNRYLHTVRRLLIEHECNTGERQKHIFVTMIHAFMQELCGYPPTGYTVTNAVYSHDADIAPHVVPTSSTANLTLFYFTAAADPDDMHDLWVKQAQVYLAAPGKEDFTVEYTTDVVFSNFFVIDGAHKDPQTGAWNLWSASDIQAVQTARVDLRQGEHASERSTALSHVMQQRLETLQYRHSVAA